MQKSRRKVTDIHKCKFFFKWASGPARAGYGLLWANRLNIATPNVDGGSKEKAINLLNQTNLDEEYEGEYISSESEDDIDSDFDDIDTSLVTDVLKLIVYLVLIIIYINMIVIFNNCSELDAR